MSEIQTIKVADGFTYSDAAQRSPEWLSIRGPRLGASEIGEYMAKGVKGQYLAGRKNLAKKIAFGKAFGVPFDGFKNAAMQAGIDNEDYIADQYSRQTGLALDKLGCAYNDWFVASPDRVIYAANETAGPDAVIGGLEIKWLYDVEYSELLLTGFPKQEHYDQMQGQMWAFGWNWVDYIAGNGNTLSGYIVRVNRNDKRIAEIMEERQSVLDIEPMDTKGVFGFEGALPEKEEVFV